MSGEAPNGQVAVGRIEGGRIPDLVATDFTMPLMNGGEAIDRPRRNPATEKIPIISITSIPARSGARPPTGARRSSPTKMAALGHGADLGGLSFIFNNVFFLSYIEIDSELRRALTVLKMRQSEHEKGLLEFTIDAKGAHLR